MYLRRESVMSMLSFIRKNAGEGSLLFFDYVTTCVTLQQQYRDSSSSDPNILLSSCDNDTSVQAAAWRVFKNHDMHGETLRFGMNHQDVASELEIAGWTLERQWKSEELEQFYLTLQGRLFGSYAKYFGLGLARASAKQPSADHSALTVESTSA